MIGLFLALLELIRQRRIRAIQDRPFGPILIRLLDPTPLDRVEDIVDVPDDESADAPAPFAHALTADVAEEPEENELMLDAEFGTTEFVDDSK